MKRQLKSKEQSELWKRSKPSSSSSSHHSKTMTKRSDEDYPPSSTSASRDVSSELSSSSLGSKVDGPTNTNRQNDDSYASGETTSESGVHSASFDCMCANYSDFADDVKLNSQELHVAPLKYLLNRPNTKEEVNRYLENEPQETNEGDGTSCKSFASQSPSPELRSQRWRRQKPETGGNTSPGTCLVSGEAPSSSTSSDVAGLPSRVETTAMGLNPSNPYFDKANFVTSSPIVNDRTAMTHSDCEIDKSTSPSMKLSGTSFVSPTYDANHWQRLYHGSQRGTPKNISIETSDKSPGYVDFSPRTELSYTRRFYRKPFQLLPNYDVDDFTSVDNFRFVDSHCHLDFLFKRLDFKGTFRQYRDLNLDSFPKSYDGCVAVFCDPQTFARASVWENLLKEDNVWGAFGCHPHMAQEYSSKIEDDLLKVLNNDKVVALGEIGLDYSMKNSCDHEKQKSAFRRQLQIALGKKLPLVIHSRDSSADTMEIMKEIVPNDYPVHRHCFTGDWAEASQWLEQFSNLYIGLTALVTFRSAKEVHDVARNIPLNRLLLETDTPYFLPRNVPREKQWSHPGMAIHVAAQIAAIRMDATLEDVLRATRENTRKVYNI